MSADGVAFDALLLEHAAAAIPDVDVVRLAAAPIAVDTATAAELDRRGAEHLAATDVGAVFGGLFDGHVLHAAHRWLLAPNGRILLEHSAVALLEGPVHLDAVRLADGWAPTVSSGRRLGARSGAAWAEVRIDVDAGSVAGRVLRPVGRARVTGEAGR